MSSNSSTSTSAMSIVPVLTGSNWLAFERYMTAYLQSQGLAKHIDSTLRWPKNLTTDEMTALDDDATSSTAKDALQSIKDTFDDFKEKNDKAKGYITMKLLPSLQHLVKKDKKAEELWSALQTKFGKQGQAATFGLFRKINQWRMNPNTDPYVQVPTFIGGYSS